MKENSILESIRKYKDCKECLKTRQGYLEKNHKLFCPFGRLLE